MDSSDKVVVAILGVGSMGRGVASALGRDGRVELRLYDPLTTKEEYDSPKDASHGADVVIICVVNEEQGSNAIGSRRSSRKTLHKVSYNRIFFL